MRTWTAGKGLGEVDGFDPVKDRHAYWEILCHDGPCPEDVKMRAERYRVSVVAVANRRKLFMTRELFFGLGPGALREGDRVAVLLGVDMPFIFREVDADLRPPNEPFAPNAKFQLVGECYLDGFMKGAAVKGVEVIQDIVLV